jgi:HlyD family secretion protein
MKDEPKKSNVPTPFLRRSKLLQRRLMPIMVWCMALAMVVALGKRRVGYVDAIGMVELRETIVAPLTDGTLQAMNVDLFDEVKLGDTVAFMDDPMVRTELLAAQVQLNQLRAELETNRDRLQLQAANREVQIGRYLVNEDMAQLDYLDRKVLQEADEARLRVLDTQLQREERLVREGVLDEATYDLTRADVEELKARIAENKVAIARSQQLREQAGALREGLEAESPDVEVAQLSSPLSEAIRAQNSVIQGITERRAKLELKAPLSGKVSSIFHRTGETVLSGDPILAIADTTSQRVLAYVDEPAARRVEVGGEVRLLSRDYPKTVVTGRVLKVNSKIEMFPLRLSPNPTYTVVVPDSGEPRVPRWGLSVLVGEIPPNIFFPGEILDVRFLTAARQQ